MRAGALDRRIALKGRTETLSSSGDPSYSWSLIAEVWASVIPLSGDERSAAEQWVAREQVKFTIRWSTDVEALSPLDTIIFPASDANDSPAPARSTYDIIAVNEQGRHEGLAILAARRVG